MTTVLILDDLTAAADLDSIMAKDLYGNFNIVRLNLFHFCCSYQVSNFDMQRNALYNLNLRNNKHADKSLKCLLFIYGRPSNTGQSSDSLEDAGLSRLSKRFRKKEIWNVDFFGALWLVA